MESLQILAAFLTLSFSFLLLLLNRNRPLIKLFPTAYFRSHRLYQKLAQVLAENKGTILLKTSMFNRVDTLVTSDPANVQHIMQSNYSVYPRGFEFRKIFDFLGQSVYTKGLDERKEAKKMAHGFYQEPGFHQSIPRIIHYCLDHSLYPVLCDIAQRDEAVDLQALFSRLMLDTTWLLATGSDFGSVRPGFPVCPLLEAMDAMGEAVFWRYMLPEGVWRLQRWLGVGREKTMQEASVVVSRTLDDFVNRGSENRGGGGEGEDFNVMSYYKNGSRNQVDRSVVKDNLMTLLFAGRDTSSSALTWLFHLISAYPDVKAKVTQEISGIAPPGKHIFSNLEELDGMVYLHGVVYETLRLFPPVPVIIRDAAEEDVLPSGHRVKPATKIMLCAYAMARMPEIWGDDCEEFKPERWISEKGQLKTVASNSFLAFGSGTWACLGKQFGIARLKAAAATILHNFDVEVLEGQSSSQSVSAFFNMKEGLRAKLSVRWMTTP